MRSCFSNYKLQFQIMVKFMVYTSMCSFVNTSSSLTNAFVQRVNNKIQNLDQFTHSWYKKSDVL